MGNVYSLYKHFRHTVEAERLSREEKYAIVSVIENYKDTGKVYLKIVVKGTSKTFNKSVDELYQTHWLEGFKKEDVAYISFLYAAEEAKQLHLVEYFPRKKHKVTKSVVILSMLFVCFLICSNLTALKVVELNFSNLLGKNFNIWPTIEFPAALVFFPLTYFFDDVLTEVYGFKMSRLIIWGGLICNFIFTTCTWLTVYLPQSISWDASTHLSAPYNAIFNASWLIFVASALGYFCGEFLNSIVLAKLKILTDGKYLFLRVMGSTGIGVAVDSIIFCNLAFAHALLSSSIWKIVAVQYLFKISYEMVMFPVTYLLTSFLKKIDNVDYYDFKTRFNPFSMSLED